MILMASKKKKKKMLLVHNNKNKISWAWDQDVSFKINFICTYFAGD